MDRSSLQQPLGPNRSQTPHASYMQRGLGATGSIGAHHGPPSMLFGPGGESQMHMPLGQSIAPPSMYFNSQSRSPSPWPIAGLNNHMDVPPPAAAVDIYWLEKYHTQSVGGSASNGNSYMPPPMEQISLSQNHASQQNHMRDSQTGHPATVNYHQLNNNHANTNATHAYTKNMNTAHTYTGGLQSGNPAAQINLQQNNVWRQQNHNNQNVQNLAAHAQFTRGQTAAELMAAEFSEPLTGSTVFGSAPLNTTTCDNTRNNGYGGGEGMGRRVSNSGVNTVRGEVARFMEPELGGDSLIEERTEL